MYVCHVDCLPAGHRTVVDVAGESVIVARDVDGTLHAYANVCRHRGAQLCDPDPDGCAAKGAIRCTYHAWTYGLDGALRATPRVDDEARPFANSRCGHATSASSTGWSSCRSPTTRRRSTTGCASMPNGCSSSTTLPFGELKVGARTAASSRPTGRS